MRGRPQVAIAIDPARVDEMLAKEDLARLRSIAEVSLVDVHAASTIEGVPEADERSLQALREAAAEADAVIVAHGSPRLDAEMIATSSRLRFIGELEGDRFFGRVDVAAAQQRGIAVVDTTHGSSRPVAEFALALLILGLRDAWRYARRLAEGDAVASTARTESDRIVNNELEDRTIGLVGFGRIGWRLTQLLRPFACRVIAFDPYAPREVAEQADVDLVVELRTLFEEADAVVCLAPLTPGTRGLIGAPELAGLRDGAVFVNVGRGAVVDTDAVVDLAVQDRQVFCLDVLDPEPIPADHPLRNLPNVLLTPHLAGATGQSRRRFFHYMVDELERHFRGLEPRSAATPSSIAGRAGTTQGSTQ